MRSVFLNTVTWILIACGAFLFVRGGLDYWESKRAQSEIASEWKLEQPQAVAAADNSATLQPARPRPEILEAPRNTGERLSRTPAEPRPGAALAKLSIPRLHAVLYVVEGDDERDLKRGPGHLIGTAFPGQPGNCVIAGHRDTHFRVLKNIQKGDEILLSRAGRTYRYRVDELSIVSPDNLAPLKPSRTPVLNLITCYPFYYVGSAPRRFVVHAYLETGDEPLRAAVRPFTRVAAR